MYYIYHIPGVKIGCAKNPKARIKRQGYTHFEILEEHSCIFEASRREIQLQKERGYPIDQKPYWKVCQMATPESRSKGAKNIPREASSRGGQLGGSNGGKTTRSLTFAQAEEIRQRYSQGGITQKELAKVWDVNQCVIGCIINKKTYIEP